MKNLVHFFITNPKLTVVLTLFLFIYGFLGLKKMNSESFPSVNFATAIIEANYQGATPDDIEVKITKPLEDEIRKVTGLKDVRSTSQEGKSKIVVRVDMDNPKVNVKETMSDIQKAIDRVPDLPSDLKEKPTFMELKSEEFPALEIAIIGSNKDRKRDIVADALSEDLEDNKKVLNVRMDGYRKREFQIELNATKLDQYHIGVSEILQKIAARNINIPGGDLIEKGQGQLVKVNGKIHNAKELGEILIRSNISGQGVYLKDLANVIDGEEEPRILARHNGEEAVLVIINKKGGTDTIALVNEIKPILNKYKTKYADQFKFQIYNNEAKKVEAKIDTLYSNAVTGLVIVIIVLLIFLPGRIGLVTSLSLPLVLLATFGIMPAFGFTLNSITILAIIIAMGMLVDNSVVVSEDYTRRRHEGASSLDAALACIGQIWIPITATGLTTIFAFLPMLVTTGIMGKFIYAIPIVVSLSLMFSLLESFFLLPMRIHLVAKNLSFSDSEENSEGNSGKKKELGWFDPFKNKFESLVYVLVKFRYITATFITTLIVFSMVMLVKFNKFILFPADQTEIYLARLELPRGTDIEVTYQEIQKLDRLIHQKLGTKILRETVGRAGSALSRPDDSNGQSGDNVGIITIYASDFAKNNINYLEVLGKLRSIEMPGSTSLVFEEMINGPPVGTALNVTFRSNDREALDKMINLIKNDLSSVKGIFDLKVDDVYGSNEVQVALDYEKVDRLGLSSQNVGNTVRTALSGTIISDVTLLNKDVDLNVRFRDLSKNHLDDLKKIKIMDAMGSLVSLEKIAHFEQNSGAAQIKRFDYKRSKTLSGNVNESQITSLKANDLLLKSYQKHSPLIDGVSVVFGGQQESTKESMDSLFNALILALIGIFAIMVYLFRSYLRPMIIMSTIPLGLVGFSVAFYFHQRPVSFLAMIGMIGLAGIIVNSGIILISFIDEMKAEGKMPLHEILAKASAMRLRAVLVTSLTTVGGLFPTAYGIGGSDAMLVPMTLAMAWGLTTGTILTIIWIPPAYAILEDGAQLLSVLTNKMMGKNTETTDTIEKSETNKTSASTETIN